MKIIYFENTILFEIRFGAVVRWVSWICIGRIHYVHYKKNIIVAYTVVSLQAEGLKVYITIPPSFFRNSISLQLTKYHVLQK